MCISPPPGFVHLFVRGMSPRNFPLPRRLSGCLLGVVVLIICRCMLVAWQVSKYAFGHGRSCVCEMHLALTCPCQSSVTQLRKAEPSGIVCWGHDGKIMHIGTCSSLVVKLHNLGGRPVLCCWRQFGQLVGDGKSNRVQAARRRDVVLSPQVSGCLWGSECILLHCLSYCF
jgi:hypothetical protein